MLPFFDEFFKVSKFLVDSNNIIIVLQKSCMAMPAAPVVPTLNIHY